MSFILTSVSLEYIMKFPLGCKPKHFNSNFSIILSDCNHDRVEKNNI